MGTDVQDAEFSAADYARFEVRLHEDLARFRELIRQPGFGVGPPSIGAEVEFSLIDADGAPCTAGPEIQREADDPRVQLELNRFNLEINLDPVPAAGEPFSAFEQDLANSMQGLGALASRHGGRIVSIGILPTLREKHLTSAAMCDVGRFRALSAGLRRERAGSFHIHIHGEDTLEINTDDVTREGAATSLQIHLRIDPANFAASFNACQLASAPALAVAGNSPFFLEHKLWDETRVALFKQSVDSRVPTSANWRKPARVSFGQGWVRNSVDELFAENAALFPVLLPVVSAPETDETPPPLRVMRLHQGTIWQWNRAIYDPAGGGHLRIEMRSLPSGPTTRDMSANAAFLIGLTVGLRSQIDSLLPAFPFHYADYNFYRAAQHGLDARLLWPSVRSPSPNEITLPELLPELLELAARGLDEIGVDSGEALSLLQVIERRVASGMTGARWQRHMLERLESDAPRPQALERVLQRYLEECDSGRTVADWSLAP